MAPDNKPINNKSSGLISKSQEQNIKDLGKKIDLMIQQVDTLDSKMRSRSAEGNTLDVKVIRALNNVMKSVPETLQQFSQEILQQSKLARQQPQNGQYNDAFRKKRAEAKEKKERLEKQKQEFMGLVSKLGEEMKLVGKPGGQISEIKDTIDKLHAIVNKSAQHQLQKTLGELQAMINEHKQNQLQDALDDLENIINDHKQNQKEQKSTIPPEKHTHDVTSIKNQAQQNTGITQPDAPKSASKSAADISQSPQRSSPATPTGTGQQHEQKKTPPPVPPKPSKNTIEAINAKIAQAQQNAGINQPDIAKSASKSAADIPQSPQHSSPVTPTATVQQHEPQKTTPPVPPKPSKNIIEELNAKIAQAQQNAGINQPDAPKSASKSAEDISQSTQHSSPVTPTATAQQHEPQKTPPPVPPKPSKNIIEELKAKISQTQQQVNQQSYINPSSSPKPLSSTIEHAKDRVLISDPQYRHAQAAQNMSGPEAETNQMPVDQILQAFKDLKALINSVIAEDDKFKVWQQQNQSKSLDDFKRDTTQMDSLSQETKELLSSIGSAGYANIMGSTANIEQAQQMSFAASFSTLDWATHANSVGNTTQKTITNDAGEKVTDLISHSHKTQLSASVNGVTKTVTKHRTIDIPRAVEKNKGPLDLALVAQDETGKNMSESKAVYLTAHYNQEGKLVEMTHPEPLRFFSDEPGSPAYTVINNEVYTLPITKEKYEQLTKEISQNIQEQDKDKDIEQEAMDKFTVGSRQTDIHKEKSIQQADEVSTDEPKSLKSMNEFTIASRQTDDIYNEKSTRNPEEISSDAPKSLKSIAPDENKNKIQSTDHKSKNSNEYVQHMINSFNQNYNKIDSNEPNRTEQVKLKPVVKSIPESPKNSTQIDPNDEGSIGYVKRVVKSMEQTSPSPSEIAQRLQLNLANSSQRSSSMSINTPTNTPRNNNQSKSQTKGIG
ncbi:Sca4 family protein [Orientia tsutsugamushi]|uniref:Antigenic heat-stable 120 kDa protein n=1 Tax=Orientia tsutsugamushi TaxID=784 RepID=A0A2U3RG88_ORITS|nr:Sca4 family protein [Orientia tsutsugamushi]KJV55432.1 surface antigen family protein [Orientia tsutsugamushi str. Kato PP]SPR12170.1 cell surface protein [Orientia tsutsugamushi]